MKEESDESTLAPNMPQAGESTRRDRHCAKLFLNSHDRILECLAGIAAEKVLCDAAPLPGSQQDLKEAKAFSGVICLPDTADAFLDYAHHAAVMLISAYRTVVLALASALAERGELSGDEVDTIISASVAAKAAADEHQRRLDWQRIEESAARFNASIVAASAAR